MALKLKKRGRSPYFYVRGTVRGQIVFESTGTADREAADALRIKRESQLLDRSVFGAKAAVTFIEAAVSYMENGGERRHIGRLIEHFGTTLLAQIDQSAIDGAARMLQPDGGPATRIRQVYTPTAAVLHHAARRKWCDWVRIERPKESAPRIRWLEPEEAARLIECASERLRPLVIFLLYTGSRLSEAIEMSWDRVNLEEGMAYVPKTKNGKAQSFRLPEQVVDALINMPRYNNGFFGYAGRKSVGRPWKKMCERAGIEDFTPHDCRHTWASWMMRDPEMSELGLISTGRWTNIRSVARYAHITPSAAARAADRLPDVTKGVQNPCSPRKTGTK